MWLCIAGMQQLLFAGLIRRIFPRLSISFDRRPQSEYRMLESLPRVHPVVRRGVGIKSLFCI